MQIFKYPSKETWAQILARPVFDSTSLFDTVQTGDIFCSDKRINGLSTE